MIKQAKFHEHTFHTIYFKLYLSQTPIKVTTKAQFFTTHLHSRILRHKRPEHGLKIATPCCQDSFVCGDWHIVQQECQVTELPSHVLQELVQVLL